MAAQAYEPADHFITPQEYLTAERLAEFKSEYVSGRVYAMAGASRTHNRLATSATALLYTQLRGTNCEVMGSDMRVKVNEVGLYFYPDVLVACGELRVEDEFQDTILNPVVVIEVLSPSTAAYDRDEKFAYYERLESLKDYLLVAQDKMRVQHFARQEGGAWLLRAFETPDDAVQLSGIDATLPLHELYERVIFEKNAPPTPLIEAQAAQ